MTWKANKNTALIVVDVEPDFMPNGALPVAGGHEVVEPINELQTHFDEENIILTQDWHTEGHSSFATSHPGKKPFDVIDVPYGKQVLWPDHCIQETEGATLHKDLKVSPQSLILRKGTNPDVDSYSAFFENDHKSSPKFSDGKTLSETLKGKEIDTIVVVGLAGDYCVAYTALDGLSEGFNVLVVKDATRSISEDGEANQFAEIRVKGGQVVHSEKLPYALNL